MVLLCVWDKVAEITFQEANSINQLFSYLQWKKKKNMSSITVQKSEYA